MHSPAGDGAAQGHSLSACDHRHLRRSSLAHVSYPRGPVDALRGLTLAVERGTFFGPNGAGKSTLIHILATLTLPTGGRARVMGFDVVREAGQVRACIGLASANENSFYGPLTARQNLEFFAALQNIPPDRARRCAGELLEMFGLGRAAGSCFQDYSTGMRQRLNMARALLHEPALLFLDEPTKGMDLTTAEHVRGLLRGEIVERQGKTVFLTTHDLDEMETLCDRVAILDQGLLRADGAPQTLIRQASATVEYRLELSNAAPDLVALLKTVPGVQSVSLVSQTAAATVLDLTFGDTSASPGVWQTLARHQAIVKRYVPKDEGLRTLIKRNGIVPGGGREPMP